MKRGILTDLHSHSPKNFMESMKGEIDEWAFLGDYDDPKVLRELIDLGGDRILTIGNHNYYFALEAPGASFVGESSRKWNELVYSWRESEAEVDFVGYCVDTEGGNEGIKVIRPGKFGKILYTHSSLAEHFKDALSDRFVPPYNWFPIVEDNFREMARRDVSVMFRGHDHLGFFDGTRIFSSDLSGKVIGTVCTNDTPFVFKSDNRYIVSVGNFSAGHYAVFDEDVNSVLLM